MFDLLVFRSGPQEEHPSLTVAGYLVFYALSFEGLALSGSIIFLCKSTAYNNTLKVRLVVSKIAAFWAGGKDNLQVNGEWCHLLGWPLEAKKDLV